MRGAEIARRRGRAEQPRGCGGPEVRREICAEKGLRGTAVGLRGPGCAERKLRGKETARNSRGAKDAREKGKKTGSGGGCAEPRENNEVIFMTLDQLAIGRPAVIVAVGGQGGLRRRLLDMGLTPHTRVKVRKVAPMGDPIELNLRGYELTLRLEDARKIEIEEIREKKESKEI